MSSDFLAPTLATLGLLSSLVGLFLVGASLYSGIPFVGETLSDRQRDPIPLSERRRIRKVGTAGMGFAIFGHSLVIAAFWLL